MRIVFRVDGIPKGQPRPRARVLPNGRASVYESGKAQGWKDCIAFASLPHRPQVPWDGPVRLQVVLFLPRPGKHRRKSSNPLPFPFTSKPDFDNAAKCVADVLTQQGWWVDDSRIWDARVTKLYIPLDGRPGAIVVVQQEDTEYTGWIIEDLLREVGEPVDHPPVQPPDDPPSPTLAWTTPTKGADATTSQR